MNNNNLSYNEAVSFLYSLQKFGIKFGLSSTSNLLAKLGNPHIGRRYIHIGGTNGKGSVSAFIAEILYKAGFKVGLYTSPHLVSFTERFKVNNEKISHNDVVRLLKVMLQAIDTNNLPTYFEATTAMALLYFADKNTDIDVIEVGMGGTLDATNIISPMISIITNVGMDHTEYLGNTIKKIATDKAGIIKPNTPVITGAHNKKALSAIEEKASKISAPLTRIGKDIKYRMVGNSFNYYGKLFRLNNIKLGLNGSFQPRNAAIAFAAIESLREYGLQIEENHLRSGAENVVWPGRFHMIKKDGCAFLLDGAHNPPAISELRNSLQKKFPTQKIILILGIMKDKDIKSMVKTIVPMAKYVYYTSPKYERSAKPEQLAAEAANLCIPGKITQGIENAICEAKKISDGNDLIVITGSFFTIGEALSILDPDTYRID